MLLYTSNINFFTLNRGENLHFEYNNERIWREENVILEFYQQFVCVSVRCTMKKRKDFFFFQVEKCTTCFIVYGVIGLFSVLDSIL